MTDSSVHPGDDFDRYVNGSWKGSNEIPSDQVRWGSFSILNEENLSKLRDICEGDNGLVSELYAKLMKPVTEKSAVVQEMIDDVLKIADLDDYLHTAGQLFRRNISSLMHINKIADDKNPDEYIPAIYQSGLGLPDMSYYTDREDLHDDYKQHVKYLCGYYGMTLSDEDLDAFLQFEKDIASSHLTRTESRDSEATYNKMNYLEVRNLLPAFFDSLGFPKMTDILVSNPKLLKFQSIYLTTVPIRVLQTQLVFRIASNYASLGTDEMVNVNFEFYGKKLSGQPELRAKWKRVVGRIESLIGDEIGKHYVRLHFPKEKQEMCSVMIRELIECLSSTISEQEWMSESTKNEAQLKLGKLGTSKVGVPSQWHSIDGLWSDGLPDDSVSIVREWALWDWTHDECRLFYKPVERELWGMHPQTVNAYYHPVLSEIVFPAGILQPPFFGESVEENLGAIGVVIGHEMTHGFDDEGRKYNARGELNDWWTEGDAKAFEERTDVVAQHYGSKEILGENVNGKLTLGENIADIGGLKIAIRALKQHFGEELTRDHYVRFFKAYATMWCLKVRDEYQRKLLKLDPHSPAVLRVNAALAHIPEFYETFGVTDEHAMYLAPEKRMAIW